MKKSNTSRTNSLKRIAWSAAILCVGCCAIIPVLVLLGLTSVAGLGIYFEFAAAVFFIASLILFIYLLFKNKNLFSKTDCSCEDTRA